MKPQPQSFRPSDFTRRDFPRLLFAFVILSAFALLIGWLPAQFLSERLHGVLLGFLLGVGVGLLISSRFARRAVPPPPASGPVQE